MKTKLFGFLFGFLLCVHAQAAGVLRTQNTASGTTGGISAQLTGVQTGDLLVMTLYERDGNTITSVADDVNGAWTAAVNRAATAARTGIYYFPNSAAGNPTITLTISGTSPRDMNVSAWSGIQTSSTLNTTGNAGNTSTTSQTHGSITPSASSLIIASLGAGSATGGSTLNTGFTALNIDAGASSQRQIYSYRTGFTGTINVTETTTNTLSSDGVDAAFLESAAAATSPKFFLIGKNAR